MNWRFLSILGGILCLAFAGTAAQPDRESGQLIVQFKTNTDEAKVKEKAEKHGGRVKKQLDWNGRAKGKGPLVVIETAEPAGKPFRNSKMTPTLSSPSPTGSFATRPSRRMPRPVPVPSPTTLTITPAISGA